jgi:hypothetical protein
MSSPAETASVRRRISLADASRGTAAIRICLGAVAAPLAVLLSLLVLGSGNPFGALIAVPPVYLSWIWIVDARALFRSIRSGSTQTYARRPWFLFWLGTCALPVIAHIVWSVKHLHS